MSSEERGNYRKATHAGIWYSGISTELTSQLEKWLSEVNVTHGPARAIIVPHAGYSFCGACSAYAYKQINPNNIKRIFILGPSHKASLQGCALTSARMYQTPIYDIPIDVQTNSELLDTGEFTTMQMNVEEAEHSIEMQLPYIAKVMENYKIQYNIVPILVGSLHPKQTLLYGHIFAPYLVEQENLFVISSDFCHWGKRFQYTYYDNSFGPIYKSIENVDRIGMEIIENLEPNKFVKYLEKYKNTICGRYPITIFLETLQQLFKTYPNFSATLKFLNYAQSNNCTKMTDSSVSYAAATLTID